MLNLISFIIFIAVLASLILWDRKKVKLEGILFIRRTKKGNKIINDIANKHRRFWNALIRIGVIVAIPTMVIGTLYLLFTSIAIITQQTQVGGAGVILPGPVETPVALPGVFVLPWWVWVIGIMCVMIPHEFFHGITFRLEKIKIKSVGWLLFLIIPGAFVEPDERQLKKSKTSTKLKAYAAGSFANLLVAFIIALVVSTVYLGSGDLKQMGVFYQKIEHFPSENLTGIIVSVDGHNIYSYEDLQDVISKHKPGDSIIIKTLNYSSLKPMFTGKMNFISPEVALVGEFRNENVYNITLTKHPEEEKAFMGIANIHTVYKKDSVREWIQILMWIYVFSEELMKPFKRRKLIVRGMSIFVLILLLFNIFGTLLV